MSCDQTLYVKLINILMDELENPQGQTQNIRTYIQVIRTSKVKTPYHVFQMVVDPPPLIKFIINFRLLELYVDKLDIDSVIMLKELFHLFYNTPKWKTKN